MDMSRFRLSTRITLAALVLVAVGALALMYVEESRLRDAYLSERGADVGSALHVQELRLRQAINTLRQDALFLSRVPPISGIARAAQNRGFDTRHGDSARVWEERLQQIFSAFSASRPDYYAISYIGVDKAGREIVRVNNRGGQIEVTPPGKLQAKGERPYFKAAAELRAGEVHLSRFGLHRENGEVEQPARPALHASTPVFTGSGEIFGVVMIGMDATNLLDSAARGLPPDVQTYIANMKGEYLLHPDARRAFAFEAGGKDNIGADFPGLKTLFDSGAAAHQPTQNSVITTTESGGRQLVTAERIHFDPADPGRFLLLAYAVSDGMAGQLTSIPAGHIVGGFVVMLLVGGFAMLALRRMFAPLKCLTAAAERISAGDYDARLLPGGHGEIGMLGKAFATMLEKLSQREQEILRINAGLEERVQERTRELELANRETAHLLHRHLALMQISIDGIHVMDVRGKLLEANDAFCDMLGYTQQEAAKLHVADWDAQWNGEERLLQFAGLIGKSATFEMLYRRKDGRLINVEVCASGVQMEGGQTFVLAVSRDITARKQFETVLMQHHRVIEASIDGFWMTDLEGNLLEANQAYAEMSGYPIEALLTMHISQLEAKEAAADVKAHIAKIVAQGGDRFESVHRHRDGHAFNVEIAVNYLPETQRLAVFCHDISERKQIEEALRVAAVTFETHDAIVITDTHANIIRVNRAFTEITGYSPEEVMGKNPRIMNSGRQPPSFYVEMWQQLLHHGSWSGEIWDKRKNGQIYPKWLSITAIKDDRGETSLYVAIFSDITLRKQAEEKIRNLAFYDPLTHLPNRRLFIDRLRAALPISARRDNYGALLFIDMDKFKMINDTLGHDYGDMLLVEVAARLKSCVREMDTVARLGGDEFTVLMEGVSKDRDDASRKVGQVAEKIRESLAQPYRLKAHLHHSSPSIGVCLYRGGGEPVDALLRHADMAMYQAKEAGRNAVRFYDPAMQHIVTAHAAMESELREAVARQQLRLYYQMQVNSDNRLLGAEALLRWDHPRRGVVAPDEFIRIAEQGTLIFEIGNWVLDTACRQLALWAENRRARDLTLAVNVSSKQFAMPDYVDSVARAVRRHKVNPARLKLELTEGMVLANLATAIEKMHALKAIGVRLSIDDFGTGYSSLSYLKLLPIDQLKIDQSFVKNMASDPNDAILVHAIIELANNFHLNVIAEGVETGEQRDFLKNNHCLEYQGFLFGKAVPIEEFEAFLAADAP